MTSGAEQRKYWIQILQRIANPFFTTLAAGDLKKRMPVEEKAGNPYSRVECSYLEGLGRSLAGIAPWLELSGLNPGDEEETQRAALAQNVREALDKATDPDSPDFMDFTNGSQPLVDSAFLAEGLLRCRKQVWEKLERRVQQNIISCLKKTRAHKPFFNNWLLFSAIIEAFFASIGEDWDAMRIDYAIRQHEQWYLGDGMYSDGPHFHWDYYNSFVIQPMLLDVLNAVGSISHEWDAFREPVFQRAQRHAAILERLIAPDGSYPPIGRSITYRFGAFHLLALAALRDALPPEISPAQVRCALTAVIRRVIEAGGNFNADGWLQIGLCGHQPALGESYISTGSLYLCLCGLLPLGLLPEHTFWSAPNEDWTSKKIWAGQAMEGDHCLSD